MGLERTVRSTYCPVKPVKPCIGNKWREGNQPASVPLLRSRDKIRSTACRWLDSSGGRLVVRAIPIPALCQDSSCGQSMGRSPKSRWLGWVCRASLRPWMCMLHGLCFLIQTSFQCIVQDCFGTNLSPCFCSASSSAVTPRTATTRLALTPISRCILH